MSVATELTRIINAKASIKSSIEAKGVTVPSSATIDTYDGYIDDIPQGGGSNNIVKEDVSGYTGYGVSNMFILADTVVSVEIPSGCTSINPSDFQNARHLTAVTIPDTIAIIPTSCFEGCVALTGVTIPSGVTDIKATAFSGCSGLTEIVVEGTTPPTLQNTNAFNDTNNCPIYVPSESVEAYKIANNWSSYSSRIQAIPTPVSYKLQLAYSNDTTYNAECDSNSTLASGDTRPQGYEYTAITSAIIGSCITSIGTNEGEPSTTPFNGCSSLSSVTIPDSVTTIGYWAFGQCTGLTGVAIPDSVTTIANVAFWGCSGMTELTIGSGVTSIGGWCFENCSALTAITVNATTPPTLDTTAFNNTNNCPIYVPAGSVETYKAASGWSTYASRIQAIPSN